MSRPLSRTQTRKTRLPFSRTRTLLRRKWRFLNGFPALIGLFFILLLAGCGSQPRLVLTPSEAEPDIQRLEKHLAEHPDDPATMRDLGSLYVLLKQLGKGRPLLMRAFEADPKDPKTLFYLGLASERTARLDHALQLYEKYPEVPESSPYRTAMQGRHEWVLRTLVQREAKRTVDRCLSQGECSAAAPSTIAVLPLRYQGQDERFAPIGLGIAELVSIDLAHVQALTVVERVRLQALLDEIDRSQGPGFTKEIGPRTGRLLGAGQLVGGAFTVQDGRSVSFSTRLLGVDGTSRELKTDAERLNRIFAVQHAIVYGVVEALSIELTPEERDAIERVPTQNLQAFLAYCRGLESENKGNYAGAARAYRQARTMDPGFHPAARRETETTVIHQASRDYMPAPMLHDAGDWSMLRTTSMHPTEHVPEHARDGDGEWATTGEGYGVGLAPLPLPIAPTTTPPTP